MPPTAGPVIAASWNVDDSHALALANSAGASSCGRIVLTDGDANARAVPTMNEQRVDRPGRPVRATTRSASPDAASVSTAVREDADVAARIPIGGVAGDDHQEQHRRQLGDADQPKRPRIAGALVEQPADRDVDHLPAGDRGEAADRKRSDEGMTECGVGVGAVTNLTFTIVCASVTCASAFRPGAAKATSVRSSRSATRWPDAATRSELVYTEIGERRYEDVAAALGFTRARDRLAGHRDRRRAVRDRPERSSTRAISCSRD